MNGKAVLVILSLLVILIPQSISTSDTITYIQTSGTTSITSQDFDDSIPVQQSQGMFVGSIKSDKYHYPSCRWAEKIKPENEIWFSSSDDARSQGYVSCGVCHPP